MKLSHKDLVDCDKFDDYGNPGRRLILQIWVNGLNTKKENNSISKLMSYSSIKIIDLINVSKSISGEEAYVRRKVTSSVATLKDKIQFHFKQALNLSNQNEIEKFLKSHRKGNPFKKKKIDQIVYFRDWV